MFRKFLEKLAGSQPPNSSVEQARAMASSTGDRQDSQGSGNSNFLESTERVINWKTPVEATWIRANEMLRAGWDTRADGLRLFLQEETTRDIWLIGFPSFEAIRVTSEHDSGRPEMPR